MFPIIVRFGEFAIHTYGVMLAVAFFLGIWLSEKRATQKGIDKKVISDLGFWILIASVIGARLLYVLFHASEFKNDPTQILAIWRGGLMFFGGFLLALVVGSYYVKKNNLKILTIGDIVAAPVGLGIFFVRIGCFLNGCCFGIPTTTPIGITFPKNCAAGYSPVGKFPLVPTQLIASLFGLALFLYLENRRNRAQQGELFGTFLLSYGVFRFLIDFVRYYEDTSNFLINQIISIIVAIIGFLILRRALKNTP